jgi:hypothetical protein
MLDITTNTLCRLLIEIGKIICPQSVQISINKPVTTIGSDWFAYKVNMGRINRPHCGPGCYAARLIFKILLSLYA